jgi:ABC-2 type transport system permease protein
MTPLGSLVRVALRVNFGLSVLRPKHLLSHKRDFWMIPLFVLGAASIGPLIYYYLKIIKALYGWLVPTGQQAVLLTAAVLLGEFFILIFGFYYVISAFYFSRDLEILIPLPLTPAQVMLSKFTVILVNEYLTVALLVLPVFISYGVLSKGGPVYWITAAFVYALLPVIPLAIVSLLVVGLMRVVNLGRKKDVLIIVGSLVLMTAALGFQYWFSRSADAAPSPEAIARTLASSDGLIRSVGRIFPPSIWATQAMAHGLAGSGLANTLLFIAVSAGLFLGLLVAAEKLFYRGLVGLAEAAVRGKVLRREALAARLSSGRRPVRAIFGRELRIMNRTPIFLLNGVLSVILIPVIFVLMSSTGSQRSDTSYLPQLVRALGSKNPATAILASALFMALCGCLNGTSFSTFSREGGQFWMSKVIPVAPRDQAKGKLLHSYAIAALGIAAATVVVVLVFRPQAAVVAAALVVSAGGAFVLTTLGMMIDLSRPLLVWTNPQKAIKQNLNVLLALFADLGVFVLMFLIVKFLGKAGLSGNALVAAVFVFLSALSVLGYRLLLAFADRRYPEIE